MLSFSGGEPLLYRGLSKVAREALRLGYRVNLITNGLTLNRRRVEELAEWASLVGVSLDGPKSIHESIRGARTFERTLAGLPILRECGVPFGIAHTVTSTSLPHLPELFELCESSGASLFQLHPLTLEGRAAEHCSDQTLSRSDLARLFLLAELFRIQGGGTVAVQLDLIQARHIVARQESYGVLRDRSTRLPTLSDIVNPLVVDERGQLWPLALGMASSQRIAGASSEFGLWSDGIQQYVEHRGEKFRTLLVDAIAEAEKEPDAFLDWYALLVARSRCSSVGSLRRRQLNGPSG